MSPRLALAVVVAVVAVVAVRAQVKVIPERAEVTTAPTSGQVICSSDGANGIDGCTNVYVDATGLGVGVTDPTNTLQVHASGVNRLALTNDNTGSAVFDGLQFTIDADGDGFLIQRETKAIDIYTDGTTTNNLHIASDGDVAIGAASPTADAKLEVDGIIVPDKVTADPCNSGSPAGGIFYNSTSNYMCFCDGTNDVQMHSPATACF